MKILQVLNSLDCGGLEKLTLDLSKKLKALGHDVIICCLEGAGNLRGDDKTDIEVAALNKKSGPDPKLFFRLARIIRRNNINVVHTHNPGPLIYGTIAAKLARAPVVINTRHGRAPRHTNRIIWGMNNAVVAISQDAKNELLQNNFISSRKVSVIWNGIDAGLFDNKDDISAEKKKLGIESSYVVGTVSRLSGEKDQSGLIRAFAIISSIEPSAKLVFAGDGPLKSDLEALARKLGLQDRILFLGFRNDINTVMRTFDIFVLSSLQEGISLSLLEAMASSKPSVATNVGGNPEVIVDGETGILVPPKDPIAMADAIMRLLKDRQLARRMGEAARRRVEEEFSLERMVREYQELYEECLAVRC